MNTLALIRLLQLASPALPVGAYTYSQGLEWAVESGTVHNEASALNWIGGLLEFNLGRFDAPVLATLVAAWQSGNTDEIVRLNDEYLASRETAEFRAETVQMGFSLQRLAFEFKEFQNGFFLDALQEIAFPSIWAGLAAVANIPALEAVQAYLFGWCENQTNAAVKLVPLGQSAGQRVLWELGGRIPAIAKGALHLPEEQWSILSPGLAIAGCRHETQYTRLFRS